MRTSAMRGVACLRLYKGNILPKTHNFIATRIMNDISTLRRGQIGAQFKVADLSILTSETLTFRLKRPVPSPRRL
jgi:hypothetical protein